MFKKIIISVLMFAVFLPFSGVMADSGITLIKPTSATVYTAGDTVNINFSSDYQTDRKHPIIVSLIYNNFRRLRIAYITNKSDDGNYSVNWKIPSRIFEIRRLKTDSLDIRIEIRGGDNIRNRFYSAKIIKINKPASSEITTPQIPETPVSPSETLSADAKLASHYGFHARLEPFIVSRLTVVNDTQNDGFDYDSSEVTDAVSKVYLKYKNAAGNEIIKSSSFINGKALFSGIDFYIPKNDDAYLDVYAEPMSASSNGGQFSGKSYKIGIQDTGNTSSTFEATGQISSTVVNSPSSLQMTASSVNEFNVKAGVLTFDVLPLDNSILLNGQTNLFSFSVSSASARLGRIVFDVNQNGLTSLDQVSVYRNGSLLNSGDAVQKGNLYLMWDAGGSSCFANTAQSGAGTGMDCNGNTASSAKLILSFSNEEIISGTNTYKLYFNVSGADTHDSVTVSVNHDDDFNKPVFAGSDSVNAKIYNGGADPELFSSATDFVSEATSATGRNIIWSDRSADFHSYVQITPSATPATDNGSSSDWSNGYLLYLNTLPAVTTGR